MSFPFPSSDGLPPLPDGIQDIGQENLLEHALKRVERKQYWNKLDPKQQGDVTIALAYLFRVFQAGQAGQRPSTALKDNEWKFVTRMVNEHRKFFTGGSAFEQFLQ